VKALAYDADAEVVDASDAPASIEGAATADERHQVVLDKEVRAHVGRARRQLIQVNVGRLAVFAAFIGFWQWSSDRLVDRLFVSDPLSVARAFRDLVTDDDFFFHLRFTLSEVGAGYGLGVGLGLTCALALSFSHVAQRIFHPFLIIFYSIPKVALAPLIIMWFGLGMKSKVLLAMAFVFFVVFMNTLAGINAVSKDLVNVSRVMGVNRRQLIRKIILPSAFPYIVMSLHITVPLAMVGAILGEFLAGNRGIGYLINAASNQYNSARVFAGIIVVLMIVLVMSSAIGLVEKRVLRWRPESTRTSF